MKEVFFKQINSSDDLSVKFATNIKHHSIFCNIKRWNLLIIVKFI